MLVGRMWTRQHQIDGPMSCLQVKLGHHMHLSCPSIAPSPRVMENPTNMVSPPIDPTFHENIGQGIELDIQLVITS